MNLQLVTTVLSDGSGDWTMWDRSKGWGLIRGREWVWHCLLQIVVINARSIVAGVDEGRWKLEMSEKSH